MDISTELYFKLNVSTKIKKNKLPSSLKLAKLVKQINKFNKMTSIVNFFLYYRHFN